MSRQNVAGRVTAIRKKHHQDENIVQVGGDECGDTEADGGQEIHKSGTSGKMQGITNRPSGKRNTKAQRLKGTERSDLPTEEQRFRETPIATHTGQSVRSLS